MSISLFISIMGVALTWLQIKGDVTMKEIIASLVVSCGSEVAE